MRDGGGVRVDGIDLNTCNTYGWVLYNCSAADERDKQEVEMTKKAEQV